MVKTVKEERNERGQLTYQELSNGSWRRYEYDKNGRETYHEDSDRYWVEHKYDENGRLTYYGESGGYWEMQEYDENGRITHYENCNGYCAKRKYHKNGSIEIYEKNKDGFWIKKEYDENDRLIYSENSNKVILDERESKENFKDLNEKNENQEIAFLFDGTKIGERSQSFNDGYVIINARTKDEAVETFKAQYGRGQHNEALCTEVVSDLNRVEQIKSSDLPCHNYIDLTKSQEQNQSNTEEQTDGRK